MRFLLASLLLAASGCLFVFDDDDDGEVCAERGDSVGAADPAPLRNPNDLRCESRSRPECTCGPCPGIADLPSWPACGDRCEGLAEAACAADAACRVIKNASCTFGSLDCLTDYMGCMPIDTVMDASISCWQADAWTCSRSNACTAYHSSVPCVDEIMCPRPFELCAPEGEAPGSCEGQVSCNEQPPTCAADETPGIANGCYTGACIPTALCD